MSGTRPPTDDVILIDGHYVAVEGGRHGRVRLPVEPLRDWSRPAARAFRVTLPPPAGDRTVEHQIEPRIGLLAVANRMRTCRAHVIADGCDLTGDYQASLGPTTQHPPR